MILSLTQELPLLLGLPLNALQGRISTLSGLFLLSQLFPQVLNALISNVERLNSYYMPFPLVVQLLIVRVGYLLNPVSGLDSLKEKSY